MDKLIYKIGLGLAVALIICLFRMPYGYYTLIRFASMVYFICLAVTFYKEQKTPLCIVAGALALLFQPFIKIVLDKATWHFVDIIVALGLVLLWYSNNKESSK